MADFLDVADSLRRAGAGGNKANFYDTVFTAIGDLQSVHSKARLDITNIELVFNALEMAKLLGKFPNGRDDAWVESAIEALKQVIASTLEERLQFPVIQQGIFAPPPYQAFAELIKYLLYSTRPKHKVAVLTFNYDLAVDFALHSNDLKPMYGLSSDDNSEVPLLKLHGSMNWAICQKCHQVIPWHLGEYSRNHHWVMLGDIRHVSLRMWSKFSEFSHCETQVSPLPFLVPPTWNKTDHQEIIRAVWQRAARELTDATDIYIIGYSLPETDAFFRMLYALGVVGGTPLRRLWVVNPDRSGDVEARFRLLLGPGVESRFRYLETDFANGIGHIRGQYEAA